MPGSRSSPWFLHRRAATSTLRRLPDPADSDPAPADVTQGEMKPADLRDTDRPGGFALQETLFMRPMNGGD